MKVYILYDISLMETVSELEWNKIFIGMNGGLNASQSHIYLQLFVKITNISLNYAQENGSLLE